jgi:hypothetical protein
MFKKEDVDDDANDDDEVRSSVSQNHVTAALITKGFSSQDSVYISVPSYQQRGVGDKK